jgi:hypothetical protein
MQPVAGFIDPLLGDKVNPMPELTLSPSQGSMNSATGADTGWGVKGKF